MAEAVKVIVRCRPMNGREKDLKCKEIISMEGTRGQCSIKMPKDPKAPPKSFTFDGAYFTDSTTEQIYADIGYELVEGVTVGFNGTIFAYGQTGCGKSFSMQGIPNPTTQRGIIPRAFDHIFETISVTEETKFLVHASYLEIYNEDVRDLLAKDVKQKLDLKEHPEKGVYVSGLTTHTVHNVLDCERVMEKGWNNRSTGATLMNSDSSRSHSIFTIHLEMSKVEDDGEDHIRVGKLNLVDLAGSERQGKTGATGDRLKEATKINLSLSALGNVISALVDGKSKHIPYRDSKLTRLLQDSLGGNTKTLMVACLSPADNNYEETLSTLRYANRAKNIKNKPKINEDPKDALLREYQEEIMKLKAMLMGQMAVPEGGFANMDLAKLGAITMSKKRQTEPEKAKVVETVTVKDDAAVEQEKARIKQEYEEQLEDMQAKYEAEKVSKGKLKEDMEKLREFYDSKIRSVEGGEDLPLTEEVLGSGPGAGERREEGHPQELRPVPGEEGDTEQGEAPIPSVRSKGSAREADRATEEGQGPAEGSDQSAANEHSVNSDQPMIGPSDGSQPLYDNETEGIGQQGEGPEAVNDIVRSSSRKDMANQLDALERLQELQEQMVGGENVNNKEVKERRKKKKRHVEERNKQLANALRGDDDGIMLDIYTDVHEELKAMRKKYEKETEKRESIERELSDQASEFEFDRMDYLDTIRKQDKESKLLHGIIDKVHPCIRRDCNYTNLDRVKNECKWDEDEGKWTMPQLVIEKTSLPMGISSGGRESTNRQPQRPVLRTSSPSDDRLYQKLKSRTEEDVAKNYFKSNRQLKLLGRTESPSTSSSWPGHSMNGNGAASPINGRSQDSGHYDGGNLYNQRQSNENGHHHNMADPRGHHDPRLESRGQFDPRLESRGQFDPRMAEQRAAYVHGTMGGGEELGSSLGPPAAVMPLRKPGKLNSIRLTSGGKKPRKQPRQGQGRSPNWNQLDDEI